MLTLFYIKYIIIIAMSELWTVDARFEDIRRILESLIAAKSFPGLHSVEFSGETVIRAIRETRDEYRETLFYLVPVKGGITRIEIVTTVDETESSSDHLAWEIVWNELRKLGYSVKPQSSDSESVGELDPWVDLEEIPLLSHRKIIRALKDDFYSNRVRKQTAIAAELGVSPATLSVVKKQWLRTKQKEMNKSKGIKRIKQELERRAGHI